MQNILAARFANGVFEPVWNRHHVSHVQIDVPETLGPRGPGRVLRGHGRVPRHGRHAPVPGARLRGDGAAGVVAAATTSRTRSSRSSTRSQPIDPAKVVRGQYDGYLRRARREPDSDTETFVALEVRIDNPRWVGRAVLPAHRQEPRRRTARHHARVPQARAPALQRRPPRRRAVLRDRRAGCAHAAPARQGARPDHDAGPGAAAVRVRPGAGRAQRARGLPAAAARRDDRRPHAVHPRTAASSGSGRSPHRCWPRLPRCTPTSPAPGAPTRCTTSSHRTTGTSPTTTTTASRADHDDRFPPVAGPRRV